MRPLPDVNKTEKRVPTRTISENTAVSSLHLIFPTQVLTIQSTARNMEMISEFSDVLNSHLRLWKNSKSIIYFYRK
jgi:hypothetical protein